MWLLVCSILLSFSYYFDGDTKKEYPINIIELDKIFILFDGDTKKEYPTTIIELFLIIRFFYQVL